jgi:hypothetical protein
MELPSDPSDEIEVTPGMVDAGIDCLYDLPELLGPTQEQLRFALTQAFRAMLRARQRALP